MRAPTTVSRRAIGGSTLANPSETLRQSTTSGQMPLVQKAVCVEVFGDPSQLTDDDKQRLAGSVNNPEFVDVLPVNSILARIVSDASDLGTPVSTILFPFFSSYIQLPIAPGEQVFVLYDDPTRSGTTVGYWLSRVSEQRTIEDVNYSVHDRRYFPEYNPQQLSTSERGRTQEHTPNFPNGADTTQTYTLRPTGSNSQNPYEGIVQGSNALKNFSFEPVPRWNKRPGEMVLQGKNNATIVLGEDRTGPVVRPDADMVGFSGFIDMVAGRGRKLPESDSSEPENNAPRIITNSRGQKEVNKTPYLNNGQTDNPKEGDPDFANDAARLLVTMQSQADINFGLTELPFPDNTLEFEQPNENQETSTGKSYVVGKADHLRFIARKNDETNGTILIVRQGNDETDLAYLHINKDGKVQIYGPEIYLGKATQKDEPYIKWTEYKKSVEKLQEQINQLKEFCQNLTNDITAAFTSAQAVPYSSIAGLTGQVPAIQSHYGSLAGNLAPLDQERAQAVEDSKSERIFGE